MSIRSTVHFWLSAISSSTQRSWTNSPAQSRNERAIAVALRQRPLLELLEDRTLLSFASFDFTDAFDRPNSTWLSKPWVEQVGDFTIRSQSLQGSGVENIATLEGLSETDVQLRIEVSRVSPGTSAGLVSRYGGANQMYWGGTVNRQGILSAEIWRKNSAGWHLLTSRTIVSQTGLLEFETIGSSLRLHWNQRLVGATTDSSIRVTGRAGVYTTQSNILDNFEVSLPQPQALVLPYADSFNQYHPSTLNQPWQVHRGEFEVVAQTLHGGASVSTATLEGLSASDVLVQADVESVTPGTYVGLVSRYQGAHQMYWGGVTNRQGTLVAEIWRKLDGRWRLLTSQSVNSQTGLLQLETLGSSLKLYWNQQLVGSTNDSSIGASGTAGVEVGLGNRIDNFRASLLSTPLSLPFSDFFAQTDGAAPTPPWQPQQGSFRIHSQALQGNQATNIATLNGFAERDVALQTDIVAVAPGSSVGLVSRFNGVREMYWGGIVNYQGNFKAEIWRKVSGRWRLLTTQVVGAQPGQLAFETQDAALRLYWNQQLVGETFDLTIINPGGAGVYASGGNVVDNFVASQMYPGLESYSSADLPADTPDDAGIQDFVYTAAADGIDDNYTLRVNGGNIELVDDVSGIVLAVSDAAATTSFTINGSDDGETLTVDFSSGNPVPEGGVTFHGNNPATMPGDALILDGNSDSIVYEVNGPGTGRFIVGGDSIVSFTGLEPTVVPAPAADFQIQIDPAAAIAGAVTATLQDAATPGNSIVTFSGNLESVEFAVPASSLTIMGDTNDIDNIIIDGVDATFDADLIIAGQDNDTLEINDPLTNVPVFDVQNLTVDLNVDINPGVITGTAAVVNVAAGASIQDAIDMAASGAIINVAAGTYNIGQIDIDKPLTLQSTGGAANTTLLVDVYGINIIADDVTVDGFTITTGGATATGIGLLRVGKSSTNTDHVVDNVTIQNNVFDNFQTAQQTEHHHGVAVGPLNVTNVTIANNVFQNLSSTVTGIFPGAGISGVVVFNTAAATPQGITISDNTFDNITQGGVFVDGAISIQGGVAGAGNGIVVSRNKITNVAGADIPAGIIVHGQGIGQPSVNVDLIDNEIEMPGFAGILSVGVLTGDGVTDVAITGNIIHGHDRGVWLLGSADQVVVNENDLSMNTTALVNDDAGNPIDASANWWGGDDETDVAAASDPMRVDFTPFLNDGRDRNSDTSGFQGDFTSLTVTNLGKQTGPLTPIEEGISRIPVSTQPGEARTLLLPSGTINETIVIDRSMTLQGAGPGNTIIDPLTGNGIEIIAPAIDVTVRDLRVTGADDGIFADGVSGTLTFTNVESINNAGDGFELNNVGDVVLTDVTATGNDPGMLVNGAASFSDTDGDYSNNLDHGIQLIDISGNVTLVRTTLENNDFNMDGTGDGLNVSDSAGDADDFAIGGSLLVQGAQISDTAAAGQQQNGVIVSNGTNTPSIGGSATFEDSTVTVQSVIVTNHQQDGINLDGVAGAVSLTNVTSSDNDAGIIVNGAGSFSDTDGTYQNNADGGIVLTDVMGDVTLIRTTLEDNDFDMDGAGDGLRVEDGTTDADDLAIGGSLLVQGAQISDTASAGQQQNGVVVTNATSTASIGGSATFEDSSGPVQSVSLTNHQQDGIHLDRVTGPVTLTNVTSENNVADGVHVNGAGSVTATNSQFNDNGDDGMELINIVGAVNLTDVTAMGNDPGILVNGAGSFSDTDGTYSNNADHGIQLIDISGNVTLIRTTLEDNDFNMDGTGDGLNASDSAGDADDFAIGGNLSVTNASILDVPANTAVQQRGVFVQAIAGSVTFTDTTVTGHDQEGVRIDRGGTDATFTNGDYSTNTDDNISLATFSGTVSLTNVTADASTNGDGLQVDDSSIVNIDGGSYSNNGNNGIDLSSISTSITITNVTADGNGNNGADIDAETGGTTGNINISGSSLSTNTNNGIELDDILGTVTLTNLTVVNNTSQDGVNAQNLSATLTIDGGSYSNNAGDGIDLSNVDDVILQNQVLVTANTRGVAVDTASSFSDTNGNISNNDDHGIQLIDISGDVTLDGTILQDNDADFVSITDGGDGLNATANVNANAIGGDLLIRGADIQDTDGAGNAEHQIRGVFVASIGGSVTFDNPVAVTGHDQQGVVISDGGTNASFINGDYSLNTGDNIRLSSFSGAVSLAGVTADNSATGDGLNVSDSGSVSITGSSSFSGNNDDGIDLSLIGGAVSLSNVTADNNTGTADSDGLTVQSAGSVNIDSSSFSGNTSDGVDLTNISGAITFNNVTANANDPGVLVNGAGSFSDTDGTYQNNNNGGIVLTDISGTVTLIRTTLQNNNAGDGLNAMDGTDADDFAIGGDLLVFGATIGDNTGGVQQNGVAVSNSATTPSIGGSVTFADSSGPAQSVTITGHQRDGVFLDGVANGISLVNVSSDLNLQDGVDVEGAESVSITGGSYSNNSLDGIGLDMIGSSVSLTNVTADGNGEDGTDVNGAQSVTVNNGSYSNNGADGLDIQTITSSITLTGVAANDNQANGVNIDGSPVVNITNGTFSGNTEDGIFLIDIDDAFNLTDVAAADNDGDGANITLNTVDPSFSASITGSHFNNPMTAATQEAGLSLTSNSTTRTPKVVLSNNQFHDNTTGIDIDGAAGNIEVEFGAGNSIRNDGNSTTGLRINGDGAQVTNLTLNNTAFDIPTLAGGNNMANNYITLANNALSDGINLPQVLNAMSASFNGATGATLSETFRIQVEDRIQDFLDNRNLGFVALKPRVAFLDRNEATSINDLILIGSQTRDVVNVFGDDASSLNFTMANENGNQTFAGSNFNLSSGGSTFLFTMDGDDLIQVLGDTIAKVFAGAGNDRIYGGESDSMYFGEDGNDYFRAGTGMEMFDGGEGDFDMLVDEGTGDTATKIEINV